MDDSESGFALVGETLARRNWISIRALERRCRPFARSLLARVEFGETASLDGERRVCISDPIPLIQSIKKAALIALLQTGVWTGLLAAAFVVFSALAMLLKLMILALLVLASVGLQELLGRVVEIVFWGIIFSLKVGSLSAFALLLISNATDFVLRLQERRLLSHSVRLRVSQVLLALAEGGESQGSES